MIALRREEILTNVHKIAVSKDIGSTPCMDIFGIETIIIKYLHMISFWKDE